ncbi:MAG: hypothetical protein WBH14_08200 [Albidovulum sp.]
MNTHKASNAKELQEKLAIAKGRDTIVVEGFFGAVALADVRVPGGVTIAAASQGAHFERIEIQNCANLTLSGLSCWPLSPVPKTKAKKYLISADESSSQIEVTGSLFRGRKDSDNHVSWNKADWNAAKIGAVFLRGPRGVIRNNSAIGVNFGYNVTGPSSEIFENSIFGFSGDALRVSADNCVVMGNRVTDAVQIDQNHADAFQAFKTSGLLNGLVVKDNVILEWTVRADNPLRAKLQGISLHNGPYAHVVIRDNSVSCTSPNGIRVNGSTDVEVTGNRVRHADGLRGTRIPGIRLTNCSGNILVQSNEAEKFGIPTGIQSRNILPDYSVKY